MSNISVDPADFDPATQVQNADGTIRTKTKLETLLHQRETLESKLEDLLNGFQADTGLTVTEVTLNYGAENEIGLRPITVELEVAL